MRQKRRVCIFCGDPTAGSRYISPGVKAEPIDMCEAHMREYPGSTMFIKGPPLNTNEILVRLLIMKLKNRATRKQVYRITGVSSSEVERIWETMDDLHSPFIPESQL